MNHCLQTILSNVSLGPHISLIEAYVESPLTQWENRESRAVHPCSRPQLKESVLKKIFNIYGISLITLEYISEFEKIKIEVFGNRTFKLLEFCFHYRPYNSSMRDVQRNLMEEPWANQVVWDCARLEEQFEHCTFFYHAIKLDCFIKTFFTEALLRVRSGKSPPQVPLLRFPNRHGPKSVQEFFDLHPLPAKKYHYDWNPVVREELLSVNLSLLSNLDTNGESSWEFFMKNHSCAPPEESHFFRSMLAHYHLQSSTDTVDKLIALHDRLYFTAREYLGLVNGGKNKHGVMLQLVIPNEAVNELCYPCKAYGKPRKLLERSFSDVISSFLEPSFAEGQDFDTVSDMEEDRLKLQARFLIQSLWISSHNIQVFVHGFGRFFETRVPAVSQKVTPQPKRRWDAKTSLKQALQLSQKEMEPPFLEVIQKKEALLKEIEELFRGL